MQQPPGGYGPPPPPPYGPPPGYGAYGPPPAYGPPAQFVVYQQAPMMPPKCSRVSYVLLGLFLGGLGIHNFVAGRVASGVIQLLLVLLTGWLIIPIFIVWFWVLIELLVVTHDGNGVKMS